MFVRHRDRRRPQIHFARPTTTTTPVRVLQLWLTNFPRPHFGPPRAAGRYDRPVAAHTHFQPPAHLIETEKPVSRLISSRPVPQPGACGNALRKRLHPPRGGGEDVFSCGSREQVAFGFLDAQGDVRGTNSVAAGGKKVAYRDHQGSRPGGRSILGSTGPGVVEAAPAAAPAG